MPDTDETKGVGAKYQKDSGKASIPTKWIELLMLWVSVKVPSPAYIILLSRAMTVSRECACMPIWNSCSLLLLTGPGSRDKEAAHDWLRRGGIAWAIQSIRFGYL